MRIDPEKLKSIKMYQWSPDFVKSVMDQYGGSSDDLASAIDGAKNKKFARGSTHRSHLYLMSTGQRNNPQKNTLEAFADVMDVAIVILPKRLREELEDGDGNG